MTRSGMQTLRGTAAFCCALCLAAVGCNSGGLALPSDFHLPSNLPFGTGDTATTGPTSGDGPTAAPSLGAWTGTVTFHAVLAWDDTMTENDTYADEPESITTLDTYAADISQEVSATGADNPYANPEDATLTGRATSHGSQQMLSGTIDEHTHLSGCRGKVDSRHVTNGPWSVATDARVHVDLRSDGTYYLSVGIGDLTDGALPEPTLLPTVITTISTIIKGPGDCPSGTVTQNLTEPAYIEWAEETPTEDSTLTGTYDPAGSNRSLDGSTQLVAALGSRKIGTVDVTWHLAKDGPIRQPPDH